jgi:DNA-binding NarL/FixJ family response regulator
MDSAPVAAVRVLIVDDHPVFRAALRPLIDDEADLSVCGEAGTASEALDAVAATHPDLVLIDVSLPDMNGIDLARALRARHPDLLFAMLSGHNERQYVTDALAVGARGYILKGHAGEVLDGIRRVVAGSRFLSAELVRE